MTQEKKDYYFSAEQADAIRNSSQNRSELPQAKLNNGKVVFYTECREVGSPAPTYFDDFEFLGTGVFVAIKALVDFY